MLNMRILLQDDDTDNAYDGYNASRQSKTRKNIFRKRSKDEGSGGQVGANVRQKIFTAVDSIQRAAGNIFLMTSSVVNRSNGIDLSHEKWDDPQISMSGSFTSGLATSGTVTSGLATSGMVSTGLSTSDTVTSGLETSSRETPGFDRLNGPQPDFWQSRI